jgi:isoamylase
MEDLYPTAFGLPYTLGVQRLDTEHHFCVHSDQNDPLTLVIIFDNKTLKFPMHRTGNRHHLSVFQLPKTFDYYYEMKDPIDPNQFVQVVDPYAKALKSHYPFGNFEEAKKSYMSTHFPFLDFDWGDKPKSALKKNNLKIYEMHIRGFTLDQSSKVKNPGTFKGAIEKIAYIKEMGFNAIELLPVMLFNECEVNFSNPINNERLYNFWGYSTLSFFCIMQRYCSTPAFDEGVNEFKSFVKACHDEGILVILDVVYNHTGEIHHLTPIKAYEYLSKSSYYILEDQKHTNFSGCGNTFNCNSEFGMQLILDSLRYFISEFHIDGFRFDLASIFLRDPTGTPIAHSPLIEAMQNDPLISQTLLISEPWDAAGLYHVGSYPKPFMEWNGWYRDVIRQFINNKNVYISDLIEAISGSPRLYSRYKAPFDSVNFITCHDGFSLYDLVSYSTKHNEANGEENRDGSNHNISCNYGHEGETLDPTIRFTRKKQVLNFLAVLFTSFGTPMITMGDESCHSKKGNNNSWCQDNALNFLNFENMDREIFEGLKELISIRSSIPFFQQNDYSFIKQLSFLDSYGNNPDPHSYGNFIAMSFFDPAIESYVYIAYNCSSNGFVIRLPSHKGSAKWHLAFNSYDFIAKKNYKDSPIPVEYPITPQTTMIAIMKA